MSPHFQRGVLLYEQQRFRHAADELRAALAEDPQDSRAHSFLALCLAQQESFDAAQHEAETAIGIAPEDAFAHYVLSHVLADRHRTAAALSSIREAIRIEPDDADYRGWHAALLLDEERADEALVESRAALELDPEHATALNVRSMALIRLGRREDAAATLQAALNRSPDNAQTHASLGWSHLHGNRPEEALVSFREALRLDPELERARLGMVEAFKARHTIYRGMLAYFLWMARLSPRARWGVILGAWLLSRVLRYVADASPAAEAWIWPVLLAYGVFVVMTWIAEPLFDLLLFTHRDGRLALGSDQQRRAALVGGCLALAIVVTLIAVFARSAEVAMIAFGIGALVVPTAAIGSSPRGWPRTTMAVYTLIAALCVAAGAGLWLATRSPNAAVTTLAVGVLAAMLSTWVALFLSRARPTR